MKYLKIKDVVIPPTQAGFFMILTDRWWVVTSEEEIMVYKNTSPQCNKEHSIALTFIGNKRYPEGCRLIYLPIVYLDHNCNDYI